MFLVLLNSPYHHQALSLCRGEVSLSASENSTSICYDVLFVVNSLYEERTRTSSTCICLSNTLNLVWVDVQSMLVHNISKISHFRATKMTFLLIDHKPCFLEDGQYFSQLLHVLLKRLNDDYNIVLIRKDVRLKLRAYQAVNEPLKCGRSCWKTKGHSFIMK